MLDRTVGRLKWDTIKAILVSKCKTPIFRQNGEFLKRMLEDLMHCNWKKRGEPSPEAPRTRGWNAPRTFSSLLASLEISLEINFLHMSEPKVSDNSPISHQLFHQQRIDSAPQNYKKDLCLAHLRSGDQPSLNQLQGRGHGLWNMGFPTGTYGGDEVRKIPEDGVVEPEGGRWTDNRCPPRTL